MKLTRKELVIMVSVIILVLVVFLSYIYYTLTNKQKVSSPLPTPSPLPLLSPEEIPEPVIGTPRPTPTVAEAEKITELISSLPYSGEYIVLQYDDRVQTFLYAYRKDYIQASDNELEQFLNRFGLTKDAIEKQGLEEYFY